MNQVLLASQIKVRNLTYIRQLSIGDVNRRVRLEKDEKFIDAKNPMTQKLYTKSWILEQIKQE